MNIDLIRAQLFSARATLDAVLFALDGQSATADTPAAGSCPHCGAAEEQQADASTLSTPGRMQCLICQTEYGGRTAPADNSTGD